MALRDEELENQHSCFNKAAEDEPIFVLRAKDKLAPMIVRHWAELALVLSPNLDEEKYSEALELADRMENYANANYDGGKMPT